MKEQIKKTLEASKRVIRDCAIENGALVAANPTKKYYSSQAKHYFYVWPRDAAFTCKAADMAGMTDIQERFFDWIRGRAEDIDADGTCQSWAGDHFNAITNDLWEERHTFPDLKDNFTYTLAACAGGLRAIHALLPNPRYIEVAGQMKHLIIASAEKTGYFYRSFGILDDKNIDASLLGLIWPFQIASADSEFAKNTVRRIIGKQTGN